MFSCEAHKLELAERLEVVTAILDATHSGKPTDDETQTDISREARGLCIVLLYASYENLLATVCRSLLEAAVELRIQNSRLRPGFRLFAIFPRLQAMSAARPARIWEKHGHELVELLTHPAECTISTEIFPDDGTHMRRSQVTTFCRIFDLPAPAPVLREIWERLDSIVAERNGIAHGRLRPGEVGRSYSIQELRTLTKVWGKRWTEFLNGVEQMASSSSFFEEDTDGQFMNS